VLTGKGGSSRTASAESLAPKEIRFGDRAERGTGRERRTEAHFVNHYERRTQRTVPSYKKSSARLCITLSANNPNKITPPNPSWLGERSRTIPTNLSRILTIAKWHAFENTGFTISSGDSGRARGLRLIKKYIDHRLVAREEPDDIPFELIVRD